MKRLTEIVGWMLPTPELAQVDSPRVTDPPFR